MARSVVTQFNASRTSMMTSSMSGPFGSAAPNNRNVLVNDSSVARKARSTWSNALPMTPWKRLIDR